VKYQLPNTRLCISKAKDGNGRSGISLIGESQPFCLGSWALQEILWTWTGGHEWNTKSSWAFYCGLFQFLYIFCWLVTSEFFVFLYECLLVFREDREISRKMKILKEGWGGSWCLAWLIRNGWQISIYKRKNIVFPMMLVSVGCYIGNSVRQQERHGRNNNRFLKKSSYEILFINFCIL